MALGDLWGQPPQAYCLEELGRARLSASLPERSPRGPRALTCGCRFPLRGESRERRAGSRKPPATVERRLRVALQAAAPIAEADSHAVARAWQIERRCREDIAFRVLTANRQPYHATICRFRRQHEQALAGLFAGVLRLCAEAGLLRVGVVALDGTKLHAQRQP